MRQQGLRRGVLPSQFILGKERMDLPMADAVQDHRFPSAFGTRNQVVRVLLRGRH